MIKIGAVWKYEKDDGTTYYSGRIDLDAPLPLSNDNTILLFKKKSDHEKSPLFDVLIGKSKPKSEGGANGKPVEL